MTANIRCRHDMFGYCVATDRVVKPDKYENGVEFTRVAPCKKDPCICGSFENIEQHYAPDVKALLEYAEGKKKVKPPRKARAASAKSESKTESPA